MVRSSPLLKPKSALNVVGRILGVTETSSSSDGQLNKLNSLSSKQKKQHAKLLKSMHKADEKRRLKEDKAEQKQRSKQIKTSRKSAAAGAQMTGRGGGQYSTNTDAEQASSLQSAKLNDKWSSDHLPQSTVRTSALPAGPAETNVAAAAAVLHASCTDNDLYIDALNSLDPNYSYMLIYANCNSRPSYTPVPNTPSKVLVSSSNSTPFDHIRTLFILRCIEQMLTKCTKEFLLSVSKTYLTSSNSSTSLLNGLIGEYCHRQQ